MGLKEILSDIKNISIQYNQSLSVYTSTLEKLYNEAKESQGKLDRYCKTK